jgi:Holliday junction resolvase-like predicted endonuclease
MNAEAMRRNAEHCLQMAAASSDDTQRMRYRRAAKAWLAVARNKARLDAVLVPEDVPATSANENVA